MAKNRNRPPSTLLHFSVWLCVGDIHAIFRHGRFLVNGPQSRWAASVPFAVRIG